jgi:hypothetical protein
MSRELPLNALEVKIMEWTITVEGVGEIGSVKADSIDAAREAAIREFSEEGYRELGDMSEVIYGTDFFSVNS